MTRSLEIYGESCLAEWRLLAQLVKPGMTDVFGRSVSLNMLCLPKELGAKVVGLTEVDPANWTSSIRFRR